MQAERSNLAGPTIQAVASLPTNVRAVLFNSFGECLVYSTDDVVYHSDANWVGYPVAGGQVSGLVLDQPERLFVEAVWASAEAVRQAKALQRE